eukprot:3940238-Rhodomonas_salina.1
MPGPNNISHTGTTLLKRIACDHISHLNTSRRNKSRRNTATQNVTAFPKPGARTFCSERYADARSLPVQSHPATLGLRLACGVCG